MPETLSTPGTTAPTRSSGSSWPLWVAASGLLVVALIVLIGASLTRRASPSIPTPTGAPNPFAGPATYVNPLEGAEQENPFYVNPFAQFEEQKPERGAPIENPFPAPSPTPRP